MKLVKDGSDLTEHSKSFQILMQYGKKLFGMSVSSRKGTSCVSVAKRDIYIRVYVQINRRVQDRSLFYKRLSSAVPIFYLLGIPNQVHHITFHD